MREAFLPNQISKLCRSTKKDNPKGSCNVCGGYHGKPSIALDYVGHAALTDRLLDCDPLWTWEPLSLDPTGSPLLDRDGGMWIKLTVCGVTRFGYGDAQGKSGGDAMKERIGDALRNAAMRFGAALDLWHKGDLHVEEDEPKAKPAKEPVKAKTLSEDQIKYFPRIKAALDTLHGTDVAAKKATIKANTAMPAKDTYPPREGVEDYRTLDGKRIEYLAHALEGLAKKKEANNPPE